MPPPDHIAADLSYFEATLRALESDAGGMALRDAAHRLRAAMLELAPAGIHQRQPLTGIERAYAAEAPSRLQEREPSAQQKLEALQRALAATQGVEDLHRLRRAFARRNHPDVQGHDADAALTELMQMANAMIDAELERRQTSRV